MLDPSESGYVRQDELTKVCIRVVKFEGESGHFFLWQGVEWNGRAADDGAGD